MTHFVYMNTQKFFIMDTKVTVFAKKVFATEKELHSENDFEAVLINFCCYECIIVPMLLRQFRREDQHKDTAGVMPTH